MQIDFTFEYAYLWVSLAKNYLLCFIESFRSGIFRWSLSASSFCKRHELCINLKRIRNKQLSLPIKQPDREHQFNKSQADAWECCRKRGWRIYYILLTTWNNKQGMEGRGWHTTFQKLVCLFVVGYYVESNNIRFNCLIVFRCLLNGYINFSFCCSINISMTSDFSEHVASVKFYSFLRFAKKQLQKPHKAWRRVLRAI